LLAACDASIGVEVIDRYGTEEAIAAKAMKRSGQEDFSK